MDSALPRGAQIDESLERVGDELSQQGTQILFAILLLPGSRSNRVAEFARAVGSLRSCATVVARVSAQTCDGILARLGTAFPPQAAA